MTLPDLTLPSALSLAAVGVIAGISNAIAGGGTLFSFPVFMASGLPPVVANASNAVAVWPGHALACVGYHRELRHASRGLAAAGLASLMGGALGAYLLSVVGNSAFTRLVPYLLVAATALFAFGPTANGWLSSRKGLGVDAPLGPLGHLGILLFSVYGGFFGAGLGVMLMAGLLLLGVREPQQNNAVKNLLATLVTSIAAIVLAVSGLVAWPQTACAFAGATIVGCLLGSRLARLMSPKLLRLCVIAFGCALSAYYFFKYHGRSDA